MGQLLRSRITTGRQAFAIVGFNDVRVDESAQGRALRLFVRACARWFNSSLTRRSSHLHASSWASHRSAPVMLSIIL
jgi:hypothetical protein